MIELRELTSNDWPTWRELRLAALGEAPYAFGSTLAEWSGDGDLESRWRDRLSVPGSINLAAVVDGRPVGMASGMPSDGPEAVELISMWVAPSARGAHVGDRLVEAVSAWAREAGYPQLWLSVVPDNTAAIGLYRRQGFVDTEVEGELMADGVRRELVMVKDL
jgi:ribosomal protein S18 acetylase RimI-like enzyme